MKRDFLSLQDWSKADLEKILARAVELKGEHSRRHFRDTLAKKSLAMIFAKPSNRTRVSFEVGMFQLGGQTIFMANKELQPGKREAISDLAIVLSGYVDGILIRTFSHELIEKFAEHSSVPVINGLTDRCHPCQVLSDIFTIYEKLERRDDITLTYVGDGNNVLYSLIYGCSIMGIKLKIASPQKYQLKPQILQSVCKQNPQAQLEVYSNPPEAVVEADVIYTDVWTSMGQEAEREARLRDFTGYQINQDLLNKAGKDCLVMHCLPAHRGEEISSEVIDGSRSIVYDQANNRLHVQKAILLELLS